MSESSKYELLSRIASSPKDEDLWNLHSLLTDDIRRLARHYANSWNTAYVIQDFTNELCEASTEELFSEKTKSQLQKNWTYAAREWTDDGMHSKTTDERDEFATAFLSSFSKTLVSRVGKRIYRAAREMRTRPIEHLATFVSSETWATESTLSQSVREALKHISEEDRSLLWERFVEGKSVWQIAVDRRVSYSAAATRVFRAKVRLRKLLEGDVGT